MFCILDIFYYTQKKVVLLVPQAASLLLKKTISKNALRRRKYKSNWESELFWLFLYYATPAGDVFVNLFVNLFFSPLLKKWIMV